MRVCLLSIVSILIAGTAWADTARYVLTIDHRAPLRVHVQVSFATPVETLEIHPGCPSYDYPEGWSTFIEPESANLAYTGDATWTVTNARQISYWVDLSFVTENWAAGNEQAGKHIDGALFVVTRSLFLAPATTSLFRVQFVLPEGYTVSAPWPAIADQDFVVSSRDALMNNTVVWGTHSPVVIARGNMTLQIAMLGFENDVTGLLKETFTPILDYYLALFPNTPRTRYLITAFPYKQNDGEAYTTSNAFTLKFPPQAANRLIWANQFAHELFHFWNGRLINGPERSDREWFSEGFTEYYSNLALLRTGLISRTEFFGMIEKTIGLYYFFRRRQYPDISLKDAGQQKGTYRFGVYNGGWCAAFVMDMMLREHDPTLTLDTFMQILFTEHGQTGAPYVLADLERIFQQLIGDMEHPFFDKYITGLDVLPVEYYFQQAGLLLDYTPYKGTAFIVPMPNPTSAQVAVQERWLHR